MKPTELIYNMKIYIQLITKEQKQRYEQSDEEKKSSPTENAQEAQPTKRGAQSRASLFRTLTLKLQEQIQVEKKLMRKIEFSFLNMLKSKQEFDENISLKIFRRLQFAEHSAGERIVSASQLVDRYWIVLSGVCIQSFGAQPRQERTSLPVTKFQEAVH